MIGGEGGIRTPDTLAGMPHFECGAFNRSATSPEGRGALAPSGASELAIERRLRKRVRVPARTPPIRLVPWRGRALPSARTRGDPVGFGGVCSRLANN